MEHARRMLVRDVITLELAVTDLIAKIGFYHSEIDVEQVDEVTTEINHLQASIKALREKVKPSAWPAEEVS